MPPTGTNRGTLYSTEPQTVPPQRGLALVGPRDGRQLRESRAAAAVGVSRTAGTGAYTKADPYKSLAESTC